MYARGTARRHTTGRRPVVVGTHPPHRKPTHPPPPTKHPATPTRTPTPHNKHHPPPHLGACDGIAPSLCLLVCLLVSVCGVAGGVCVIPWCVGRCGVGICAGDGWLSVFAIDMVAGVCLAVVSHLLGGG